MSCCLEIENRVSDAVNAYGLSYHRKRNEGNVKSEERNIPILFSQHVSINDTSPIYICAIIIKAALIWNSI